MCPSTDGGANTHKGGFVLFEVTRSKIVAFAGKWRQLEITLLTETRLGGTHTAADETAQWLKAYTAHEQLVSEHPHQGAHNHVHL